MSTNSPQLVALGTNELTKLSLQGLLNDSLGQHLFDNYDPTSVSYVNGKGKEVAKGLPALLA
jgi:hypothetical protein